MRVGVLCSGGKDSLYAAFRARETGNDLACLISIESANPDSYLFHTPNIRLVGLQAQAAGLPHVRVRSQGEEEVEVLDLECAILAAKSEHGIEGIVTGAIRSVYQATRVQKVCSRHDLWCFNPLWLADEESYLERLLSSGFSVLITGVYAEPFGEAWLGRRLDESAVEDLKRIAIRYRTTLTGEGGEFETFVTDCPLFMKRIDVLNADSRYGNFRGTYSIGDACLAEK
jgi:ABC transporter with metal-binding/Fe-S-binding domain ATP-binding protein